MKKSMFLLGIATVALASCTNEEVTEMPQNRAIGFNTFVNASTRVTEIGSADGQTDLTDFYVFGRRGTTGNWTNVYTNVEVNGTTVGSGSVWTPAQTAYWYAGQHEFGAYSDGNAKLSGVTFDPDAKKLSFSDYEPKNDLIAAVASHTADESDLTTEGNIVSLSFNHMLSQVKFSFTNTDSRDYKVTISDLKIAQAITKGDGTYSNSGTPSINWTGTADGTYSFASINDIAEGDITAVHSTDLFVIPQSNETLNVTFHAAFYEIGSTEKLVAEQDFTASVAYNGDKEGTEANKWTPRFRYNYTTELNIDDIDEDKEEQKIQFSVTAIDEWDDATDTPITPVVQ